MRTHSTTARSDRRARRSMVAPRGAPPSVGHAGRGPRRPRRSAATGAGHDRRRACGRATPRRRSMRSTPRSPSSRRPNPDIDIAPTSTTGPARRSPRCSPAARCPTCSRSRSPTASRSSSRASSPTSRELVTTLPYADKFNPNVLATARTTRATSTACRPQAYGIGLQYNRQLFEQAGLDPDQPPTTWDEVRAAAKQIAEKTGQAGYVQMSQSNTGGWQSTIATYARGGRWRGRRGRHRHLDRQQPGHQGGARVPQGPPLGGRLDGLELPLRLGHQQPGVRRRPDRHVHQRLGRLHAPGPDEPDRPGHLRPDDASR